MIGAEQSTEKGEVSPLFATTFLPNHSGGYFLLLSFPQDGSS